MTRFRRTLGATLVATALSAAPAWAQASSNEAAAALTAVLAESLSVTLLPPATAFTLASGSTSNPAALPLVATTTWTLALTRSDIALYAYFTNAATAMQHTLITNTVDIPSSRVEVAVNGGAMQPLDQTVPFGGASAGRRLWTQPVSVLTATGLRIDTLTLNINLNGLALPADIYAGILRVRAQATP